MKKILLLIPPIIIFRCAALGPPPGGPKDETSPTLVNVSPESGTTGIEGGIAVELTFSERLSEETDFSSILLSPIISSQLDFILKKEIISVGFPNELDEDQTYILTLTRDLKDERENRLDRTYQIALSTGTEIASGRISGMVHQLKNGTSAIVYLFAKDEDSKDSLLLSVPDYYTETDDSGRYVFDFLDHGHYITLAHSGASPPAPIRPSTSNYGLYWKTLISLDQNINKKNNVNMLLGKEVSSFRLLSVKMDDSVSGTMVFNNSFDLSNLSDVQIKFISNFTETGLAVSKIFQYADTNKELRFFIEGLNPGESYSIVVSGLKDSIDQHLQEIKRKVQIPEIENFQFSIHSTSANEISIIAPGNSPFSIQFTKPIIILSDSVLILTNNQGDTLKNDWEIDDSIMNILPDGGWTELSSFTLKIFGNYIESLDGSSIKDSILTYNFETSSKIGFGGVIGKVNGPYFEGSIVIARSLEKEPKSVTVSVNSSGEFKMEDIPEGKWMLSAFQDKDGNGRYTHGNIYKNKPSEPFTFLVDTIEVRANWDIDGIELIYPKNYKQ